MTLPPESRPPESAAADARPTEPHPNYRGPRRTPVEVRPDSAPLPVQNDEWLAESGVDPPPPPPPMAPPIPPPPASDHPSGPFRPHEQHDEGPWSGAFAAPVVPRQRPVRPPKRSLPLRPIAIAAVVVVVVGGLGWWAVSSPGDDESSATAGTATTSVMPEADARARLRDLLPPGYAEAACEPVATPRGALAKFGCERNADAGGPPLATYTLVPNAAGLKVAFDDIIKASKVVDCPGAIQSPGPWRRNASPDKVAGTLFCGFQRDLPTVAWTNDAESLVSAIRGDETGPTLDQLYQWWSSHS